MEYNTKKKWERNCSLWTNRSLGFRLCSSFACSCIYINARSFTLLQTESSEESIRKSNNSNYSAIQMRDICLQVSIQINITDVRCVFFARYTFLVHCMCSQWETRKSILLKGPPNIQLKDKSWVVISATFTCQIIQTKRCVCFPECKASACITKPDEKHCMYVHRWLKGSAPLCHSLNRADTKRCASLAGEQEPCSNSGTGHSPRLFVAIVTWKVAKSGWKMLKQQWDELKHDMYSASESRMS